MLTDVQLILKPQRGYLHDPLARDGDGPDLALPDLPALVTDGQQPPPRILWDQVDRCGRFCGTLFHEAQNQHIT